MNVKLVDHNGQNTKTRDMNFKCFTRWNKSANWHACFHSHSQTSSESNLLHIAPTETKIFLEFWTEFPSLQIRKTMTKSNALIIVAFIPSILVSLLDDISKHFETTSQFELFRSFPASDNSCANIESSLNEMWIAIKLTTLVTRALEQNLEPLRKCDTRYKLEEKWGQEERGGGSKNLKKEVTGCMDYPLDQMIHINFFGIR